MALWDGRKPKPNFFLFFIFFSLWPLEWFGHPKNGLSQPFGQNGGGPVFFFLKKKKPQNKINKKYVSHISQF
jgi:hypothetical protein